MFHYILAMLEVQLPDQGVGQSQWPLSRPAHNLLHEGVVEEIGSNPKHGLTSSEVQRRLEQYGRNDLGNTESVQPAKMLLRQVANAMTLVWPIITSGK